MPETNPTQEGEENAAQHLEQEIHNQQQHNQDIPPAASPSFHAQNR